MSSLFQHLSAFLFFLPIGIRRLFCCFALFIHSPSFYRSKAWYLSEQNWKNIDLYFLVVSLPIAFVAEIFFFQTSQNLSYKFSFIQQSYLIFIFWIALILVLLREKLDLYLIHENLLFLFGGIGFIMEYYLMGNGGHAYGLLNGLTLLCASSCIYLSFKPIAIFADVALSCCLTFKGTWILQLGLSFFTDFFSPKGCRKFKQLFLNQKKDFQCDLEDDGLRAIALIDFLFIGHALVILVLSLVLYGVLSCNNKRRGPGADCDLTMEGIDGDSMLIHPSQEIDED